MASRYFAKLLRGTALLRAVKNKQTNKKKPKRRRWDRKYRSGRRRPFRNRKYQRRPMAVEEEGGAKRADQWPSTRGRSQGRGWAWPRPPGGGSAASAAFSAEAARRRRRADVCGALSTSLFFCYCFVLFFFVFEFGFFGDSVERSQIRLGNVGAPAQRRRVRLLEAGGRPPVRPLRHQRHPSSTFR